MKIWSIIFPFRWLRRLMAGLALLVVAILVINWIPAPQSIEENPFIVPNDVQIIAHSGGKGLNPEETLRALKQSGELYGADMLEFDLQLTGDDILVLSHDDTINQYGILDGATEQDTPVYIRDLSLAQLRTYNFGINWQHPNGQYPFRDFTMTQVNEYEIGIATMEEVFEYFEDTQTMKEYTYTIEIKNDGVLGIQAADQLIEMMEEYDVTDRVIVASFHKEVGQHVSKNYPDVMRSAYYDEVLAFVATNWVGLDSLVNPNVVAFQIPVSQSLAGISLNLSYARLIQRAERHHIAMHYWTVNDEETMRMLVANGAHGIITDFPNIALEVLVDMGIRS